MAFRKALLRTAASAAAAALSLCCLTAPRPAAAQAPASGEKTKITVWHYFSEDQSKPFEELVKRFQAANPDVEVTSYFQGKPNELRQKLEASFATTPGTNPVMSTVYENWTSAFLDKDLMDPVEDYTGKPEGLTKEDLADIVKAYREGNSWNGKMVTAPFAKSIYMMYLNMDKLAAAGITTAPKTQDEWKTMVQKTTTREGHRVSTYGAGVLPQSEAFTTLYLGRGADFFDKDGNPIFDGPDGVATLALLQSLTRPDKDLYIDPKYMSDPFGSQLIASYIYSSASFPYNNRLSAGKFHYEAAAIPGVGEGMPGKAVMQGMNLGIFKNRPEAERKAAMRLIKFLTETKNGVYWQLQTGYMPIRYSAMKDPDLQAKLSTDAAYALATNLIVNDRGRQEPKFAEWDGIRNDLSSVVDRVLNRNADPKTELTALKEKVVERMKKK